MGSYKACVVALIRLINKFIKGAFGAESYSTESNDGIAGVHSIPRKGQVSDGLDIKNDQLYGMLRQLEREIWDLVLRWEKLYRKGMER